MTMPRPQQPPGLRESAPPPRRNRVRRRRWARRKVLAIVAAGVVLLSGLVFAVIRIGPSNGFPRSEYRLTEPRTLVNGEYQRVDGLGWMVDEGFRLSPDSNFRDPHGAGGQYTATDGKSLTVTGGWGQIRDPDKARGSMLRGPATADGTTIAVPAEDMTPAGAPVKIICQVLVTTDGDTRAPSPMCVWADGNTKVSVELTLPGLHKPEAIDLAELAQLTLDIRAEIRRPM
ncbi:hypothetical protein ACQEVG_05205 [Streptomyces sp. CA-135486]|uniref:hypothetical protein n=1 Tax=Streptomyces sp. CA-135486 TaxID=3240049 RepID=UPI003D90C88B